MLNAWMPGSVNELGSFTQRLIASSVHCELRPSNGTYHQNGPRGLSFVPVTEAAQWRFKTRVGLLVVNFTKSNG